MTAAPKISKASETVRSMSLLDWRRTDDGYAGGDYRIRLAKPGCWEIDHRGEPVASTGSLKLAMTKAEFDYRERLRRRDLARSALAFATFAWALLGMASAWTAQLWFVVLFSILVGGLLTSLARFVGAASFSFNDPYRRRLPWEKRDWWTKHLDFSGE